MPSYSVNLNAVVAQAATAVTRLQVVCSYGGSESQVCVANTSNLAAAGGKPRGVALENAAAGFPIQIIDFGSVDNPGMVGSGAYVAYDGNGNLVRQAQLTAQVVGTYENGVIHVNLGYAALAAAAGVTWLVVTDPAFGAIGDGVTDDTAAIQAAFTAKEALGYPCRIYFPPTANGYLCSGNIDIGRHACIIEGDGVGYYNQGAFGSAAWSTPGVVTGSVVRFTGSHGFIINSSVVSCAGITIRKMGFVGGGSGDWTGFYNQAEGGCTELVVEDCFFANWYRALDIGGFEETKIRGLRVMGCVYGVPVEGTPIAGAGATNSQWYDCNVQFCVYGFHLVVGTGLHFSGGSMLSQTNGLDLTISAATAASPIVATVSSTAQLRTGMRVKVDADHGLTGLGGWQVITVVDSTHVSFQGSTGAGAYAGGAHMYCGGGVVVAPNAPGLLNGISFSGQWFENNKSFGVLFDLTTAGVGASVFRMMDCRFAGTKDGINFTNIGAGAAASGVLLLSVDGRGSSLTVPAGGGFYGLDIGCLWASFTNGYPAGWDHIDPTNLTGAHFQTVSVSSGLNKLTLGNSVDANSFQIGNTTQQTLWPIIGGDGTNGVAGSIYGVHGLADVAQNVDYTLAATEYSRVGIRATAALTAPHTYTWPTPSSATGAAWKIVVNAGSAALTNKCGAGTTVAIAAGKTALIMLLSTGDVIRLTADV